VGKDIQDVTVKQSVLQKSVNVEMLAFYVVHNVMTVCHAVISNIIK